MPNKISQQSVREAALPLTVWGMVHCSGRWALSTACALGAAGLREGRQGGSGGGVRGKTGWGFRGVRVLEGTRDVVQYNPQTVNTEGPRERQRQGQDLSPCPKHQGEQQWTKAQGAAYVIIQGLAQIMPISYYKIFHYNIISM